MGKSLLLENSNEVPVASENSEVSDLLARINALERKLNSATEEALYWKRRCEQSTSKLADGVSQELSVLGNIRSRVVLLVKDIRNIRAIDKFSPAHESNHNFEDSATLTHAVLIRDIDGLVYDLENEILTLRISGANESSSVVDGATPGVINSDVKISLSSFNNNDIALFFPTPRGDYLAFHIDSPHHYLSEESKALIGNNKVIQFFLLKRYLIIFRSR